MTSWNEKWAQAIKAVNAKAAENATEPENFGPVEYNVTAMPVAADAKAAERAAAIESICEIAGMPQHASGYIARGVKFSDVCADLQRHKGRMQAH